MPRARMSLVLKAVAPVVPNTDASKPWPKKTAGHIHYPPFGALQNEWYQYAKSGFHPRTPPTVLSSWSAYHPARGRLPWMRPAVNWFFQLGAGRDLGGSHFGCTNWGYKLQRHQGYLKEWLVNEKLPHTLDALYGPSGRKCIAALSNKRNRPTRKIGGRTVSTK